MCRIFVDKQSKVAALVEESKKFQKMVGKMKHLKLDKHGDIAGGHNPEQVPGAICSSHFCFYNSVFDIDDNAATANAEAKSMLGPEDAGAIRRQEGVGHMCLVR